MFFLAVVQIVRERFVHNLYAKTWAELIRECMKTSCTGMKEFF